MAPFWILQVANPGYNRIVQQIQESQLYPLCACKDFQSVVY